MSEHTNSHGESPVPRPFSLSTPTGVDPFDAPVDSRRITPVPAPPREDPREIARRLVEEARAKAVPTPISPPSVPASAPAAPAKRSLASRTAKVLSPEEAVEAAKDAEVRAKADAQAKAEAVARAAAESAAKAETAARLVAEAKLRAQAEASKATPVDRQTWLASMLPGFTIQRSVPIQSLAVFRALWTAHRARALATHDLTLLVTATALLDAAERIPAGGIVAFAGQWQGRSVAIWVDATRPAILATVEPSELYLAGL